MNDENTVSRRHFVTGTLAAASSVFLGTSGRAEALTKTPMNFDDLKEACKGVVATAGDANFTGNGRPVLS